MKKILSIFLLILLLLITSIPVSADQNEEDASVRRLNDEIIYNILVDRYNNGAQAPSEQVDHDDPYAYQGGDIKGVTDQLQEIDQNGFTAISLSPIMENAKGGYHGYWVDDFFEVEDEFGTMKDLQELIKKAHELDIKVLLELDLNYISKTSDLAKDDTKADWFKKNEVEPIDATEWLNEVKTFDQSNKEAAAYLNDVADYWMKEADIDGYTLHAADQMNPEFLQDLASKIKSEKPNFYLIATTLQGEKDVDSLFDIEELDAIANPEIHDTLNDVFSKPDEPVSDILDTLKEKDNKRNLLYLDNMNTPRFSNNFAEQGRAAETTWNVALGYLYFSPGVPFVYQGSEIPMYGPGYPENQYLVDFSSEDPDVGDVFSKMASIREQYPSLARGEIEETATNEGLSLFKRTYENEVVYVAINNDETSHTVEVDADELTDGVQLRGLLHDDTIREKDGKFLIGMERESSEVFVVRDDAGFNWAFISFVVGILLLFIGFVIVMSFKQRKRERNNNNK